MNSTSARRPPSGLFAAANKTMSEQKQQIQKFEGDAQEKETALRDLAAENENLNGMCVGVL